MKQYVIMKKWNSGNIQMSKVFTNVYDENNVSEAIKICKDRNEGSSSVPREYIYFVAEMVPIAINVAECDMSEDEVKLYRDTLNEMNADLNNIVDYDEWAAREYGETKVDYYSSAIRLYNAGYRKITKIEE